MRYFLLLSSVLGACCVALEAFGCTPLPQYMDLTLRRSPLLNSARIDIDIADNNLTSVRSNWRPQVSAIARSAAGDTQFSQIQVDNSLGVSVSQRVFDFGRSGLQRSAFEYEKVEASARYSVTRENESLNIVTSYVNILEANETLMIMNERQSYLREQIGTLNLMLTQGSTTISNVSEAKAELAGTAGDISFVEAVKFDAQSQLITRNGKFEGVCSLNTVLAWLDDKPKQDIVRKYSLADIIHSPLYRAESAKYQSLKVKEKIAKRSKLPIIEAVGTSLYGYDNFNDKWSVRNQIGVEIRLPLVTGGRQKAKQTHARLDALSADFKTRNVARLLHQKTMSTKAQFDALTNELSARTKAKAAVLAYYRSAVQEYQLGALTFSELVEIRLKRDQANLKFTKVKYDLIRQRLRLISLTVGLSGHSNF